MNVSRRQFIHLVSGATLGMSGVAGAEQQPLITKKIPGTDESLPVVGLGTNKYVVGSAEDNALLRKTLQTFQAEGGTVVDTAPMYRTSENILGQLMGEIGNRPGLFIATKSDRETNSGGLERLAASFENLATDTLDLVQSHNLRGAESMLPVLQEYKQAGKIRYVGITTSRTGQFPDVVARMKNSPLDFVQVNYSLIDREAEKEILPLAREKGIAVLVNLPLARGQLFKTVGDRPLPNWAADFRCTSWAQFFLKYVVGHPDVTCAIPGMTKSRHVVDNLGAAHGRLPTAQERKKMEALIQGL